MDIIKDGINLKCLMLNTIKDLVQYGSNNSISKNEILKIVLTDNGMNKCLDILYEQEFILHLYITDSFDSDIIIGVNRYEKCQVKSFDEKRKIIEIKGCNKEFFNNSQLNMLRKDKIGNII